MRQTSNSPELHDLTGNELCVYFGSENEEKIMIMSCDAVTLYFGSEHEKKWPNMNGLLVLKKVESPNFPVICLKTILL